MREAKYWTWFILAGLVIFIFGGLHMIIIHLNGVVNIFNPAGLDPLAWENVAYRSRSAGFTLIYIILLGAALYHAFYGLRTILLELGLKQSTERKLTVSLWFIGTVLFVVGALAALAAKITATNL